ncbi:hypothetical protein MP638_001589 [Amoeboaphelidium occidentale]|nr:hypothetical protein MP638_001589 [Amoeboaphelidium occidentale]
MDSNYVKIEQKEEEAVTKEEQEQEQKEIEEQPILERDEEEEGEEEEEAVAEKEEPPLPESTLKKPTTVIIDTKDGVFANMAAKPEIPSHSEGASSQQQEDLPTYADVADDRAPDYGLSSVVFLPNDDTPLVDGIPMGTFLHFVMGAIVSYTFQLVGFILAFVFAVSHAGRSGARVGLGINMVQYGTYLSRSVDDQGYLRNAGGNSEDDSSSSSSFLSYFLMLMGWIIIIQALVDYYRVYKQVKGVQVQRSSNENNV